MGISRDNGFSASVEGWLVVDGERYRVAKSNPTTLFLAEPCVLPPGTAAQLLIVIDGSEDVTPITLPNGILPDQFAAPYEESLLC